MKVAVIGLGSMGYGIASSLLRAGHSVMGRDVNPQAVRRLEAEGGTEIDQAALEAAVVVVLNAAQTEAVLFGADGIVPRMRPGSVVICCVTVAPDFARRMEARWPRRGALSRCADLRRIGQGRAGHAVDHGFGQRRRPLRRRARSWRPSQRRCSSWATGLGRVRR